jgi:pimeloyl-ACP methyl ester carboxylesterase
MEAGTGEPVVLLHGIFGKKEHWHALGSELAGSFRVIAPDLPLHGKSKSFGREFMAPEAMARAVHGLTTGIGLARYHTAGNSLGAGLAAVLAVLYPDRVASVAFLGAPPVSSPVESEVAKARAAGINLLVPRTIEEFDRKISLLFTKAPNIPPDKLRKVGINEIAHWEENNDLFNRIDVYFMEGYVDRVACPTLCVWGQEDRLNDISGATHLAERMKDCELVIVPDAGHAVMQEDFRTIARKYLDFLERHPIAGSPGASCA